MKVSDDDILDFLRESPEPVLTSKEVAEKFGIQRQSAHERLQSLNDDGAIARKDVGPSVVWFLRE